VRAFAARKREAVLSRPIARLPCPKSADGLARLLPRPGLSWPPERRRIMRKPIAWITTILVVFQITVLAMTLSQQTTWGGPDVDEADEVAVAPDGSAYVTGTTLS